MINEGGPMNSEQRVAAGAAWLDEVAPGWERKIDLSTLDISEPCQCVCGQVAPLGVVEGTYRGPNGYSPVERWAEENYGSGASRDRWLTGHGFQDDFDTEAWIALIKERFDTGTLSDEVAS